MSCRRICRELLWLARFGELGPSSQPHLEHLASCRGCRDEVGFDRAMVEQLRAALAERVANAAPSPRAWEGILARAQVPETRPPALRLLSLVGRLRFASAMAGTGLALVLALNTQIVPMAVSGPSDGAADSANLLQVPRIPPGQTSSDLGPAVAAPAADPEQALADAARAPAIRSTDDGAGDVADEAPIRTELRVVRAMQTPEPGADNPGGQPEEPSTAPLATEPGEPS
jgi:hypothetical protein